MPELRTGPQQRRAVAQKAGSGGDHPDQDGQGSEGGAERELKAAIRDQKLGLGGLRDVERVRGQQFNERISAIALGESGEALLELRESGFSGSDRAAASQASQRQRQPGGGGNGQDQDESEAGGGHAAMREGERIGDGDQHQRRHQSTAGEDGQAAQHSVPAQTLLQLRNVGVKLFAETHGTSHGGHFNT